MIKQELSYLLQGYAQKITKKKPIEITLFVTNKCNANCIHCFYYNKLNNKKEKELSLDEFKKISSNIDSFSKLLVSGGEPFLREDLVEICKTFHINNKVKEIRIPTNGYFTKKIYDSVKEIVKECPDLKLVIQLSIDGLRSEHDKIRNLNNSFNNLIQTYYELKKIKNKEKNIDITFCFTLSKLNHKNTKKVYDFVLKKLNHDKIGTILIRNDVKDQDIKHFDLSDYSKNYYKKDNKWSVNNIIFRRLILKSLRSKKRIFPCNAGTLNAVITETGKVYACEFKNHLFDLREVNYNFKKEWNSKRSKQVRNKISKKKCYCTDETIMANNIRFSFKGNFLALKELMSKTSK
jgi:MoaA/NifB/PqqE/SkfB family radical SAM enzyme